MDRETVYKMGVKSGLLMEGQDFGFRFDEVMKFAELVAVEEIERLRGEVEELTNKLQMMKDESILFKVNVGLARDLKNAITERDAALALLRELVETRDKHYIYQTQDMMPRWDERVAAAIRARGEI